MADVPKQVVVVTGGSQGLGRGIALALGDAGAVVYLTGRNGEALEAAAAEVTARGGRGMAVRCDHTHDSQVEALFRRIQNEQPGLDALVNNVWGGYEAHPNGLTMQPFWKLGLDEWDAMFTRGLRAHFAASRLAAPSLIQRKRGLIVNTIAWAEGKYLRHLYYDGVKQAIARMTYGMALELREHGVAAVALAPGFVRTERAREYGFTDIDGRQPPPFRMPPEAALD